MRKIALSALVFSLLPLLLPAQYERILNDPDVIWAAKINMRFDLENYGPDSLRVSEAYLLKKRSENTDRPYPTEPSFGQKIFEAVRAGHWEAWSWEPGDSLRLLTRDEAVGRLAERDTVTTVDVETGLTRNVAVENDFNPEDVVALRAHQLLFFNQKTGEFDVYTWAIAPVVRKYIYYGLPPEDAEAKTWLWDFVPFWLKMPPYSPKKHRKKPSLDDPNISLAYRMKTVKNSPELDSLPPMKDFRPPVMERLLDRAKGDADFKIEDSDGEPLGWEARQSFFFEADTVVTFDPETYEEVLKIVKNDVHADACPRLRLLQDWFWDDRAHRLVVRLHAFAPLRKRYDSDGNFRFEEPLFWRRKE